IASFAISAATFFTSGAAIRHGPHHAAQKSTRTGTRAPRTTSSKVCGSASMGSAIGGNSVLQAPHRPVSARCFAGMRLFFPQEGRTGDELHVGSLLPGCAPEGYADVGCGRGSG